MLSKILVSVVCLLATFFGNRVCAQAFFPDSLGMQTYTFRSDMKKNVSAALDAIKSAGLTIVESSINPEGMSPEQYRALLDQHKLRCVSVGADYAELVNDPMKFIAGAKTVGARYIMTAWIPHDGPFTIATARKAVDDFNRVGKIISANGLTFCYHTHGYEFLPYENGTLFDYIVGHTNPRDVSFEMDIMWVFHGGQDPAKLLDKYSGRWKLMHLKDLRKGVVLNSTGATDENNDVVLGTGQLNIPEILKAAKRANIQYYFIEDESSSYMTQVSKTIAYLRTLR